MAFRILWAKKKKKKKGGGLIGWVDRVYQRVG